MGAPGGFLQITFFGSTYSSIPYYTRRGMCRLGSCRALMQHLLLPAARLNQPSQVQSAVTKHWVPCYTIELKVPYLGNTPRCFEKALSQTRQAQNSLSTSALQRPINKAVPAILPCMGPASPLLVRQQVRFYRYYAMEAARRPTEIGWVINTTQV